MKRYLDCWISAAKALFAQALVGEPQLIDSDSDETPGSRVAFLAELTGDIAGRFTVTLDPLILETPLLGDGIDQAAAWRELLREVAEGASGELLASSGLNCRIATFDSGQPQQTMSRAFRLTSAAGSWALSVLDDSRVRDKKDETAPEEASRIQPAPLSSGVELLLDVELEAALRFGSCEMPLGEILELGPGDVVELDRHVSDPVDLLVGDKIVARGEVVLVNGNFGLRVTEVATPQRRLESIRCLF
jgi:flagellar motor switch protein FliN/FliY